MAPLEFDPRAAAGPDGLVRVDEAAVAAALQRGREAAGGTAPASGWDQSFRV